MTPEHPPKPRLVLRVGITGHRPDKLKGPAVARAAEQLGAVFSAIEIAAAKILKDNEAAYSKEPPVIRLVSGLAEGADQIAVTQCPPAWVVEAVLPFPKDEYLRDFEKSAGDDHADVRPAFLASLARAKRVTELDFRWSEKRVTAYVEAGGYLLGQIDLLIAVWDGKPPKPGGTGALARKAFEAGIPVAWPSTQDKQVPRLITGFDDDGSPDTTQADCTKGPLTEKLSPIFDAPSSDADGSRRSPRAGLDAFYAEEWRPQCRFPVYDLLNRFANRRKLRLVIAAEPFAKRRQEWDKFIAETPEESPFPPPADADTTKTAALRDRIKDVLVPRFVWADSLAIHFSHYYRSAYVLAYLLSALAVFIGLGGIFVHSHILKGLLVALELAVIVGIIWLVWYGRRHHWHERWIDYRALAENLRHSRFLTFVSEFGRIHNSSQTSNQRQPAWMLWYIRATVREIGLPNATLDSTYRWRLLKATLDHEIEDQIDYHTRTSKGAGEIDHLLHSYGERCFFATFFILSAGFLGYLLEGLLHVIPATAQSTFTKDLGGFLECVKPALIFFSAGLPALGAALAGIRVHGDFEGSKERSLHMLDLLNDDKEDYENAKDRYVGLNETGDMLISTARLMSEDLAAWQDLYGRKRLTLPA